LEWTGLDLCSGISHFSLLTGKRVKRILDIGRLHYIRTRLNMKAKLVQYCEESLSPECMMIVCTEN